MKKLFISASLFLMVALAASAQKIVTANTIVDCGQTVYQSPAFFVFVVFFFRSNKQAQSSNAHH